MANAARYQSCPGCGTLNPLTAKYCRECQRQLSGERTSPPLIVPGPTDPLSYLGQGRIAPVGPLGMLFGPGGVLWFSLGIVSVVFGIFFLIAGSLVLLLFGPSSPGCASDPLCAASPALHIIFVALGVLLLVLGIYAFVHGFRRSTTRSTWLTLPP
jgi:hypothetical protein